MSLRSEPTFGLESKQPKTEAQQTAQVLEDCLVKTIKAREDWKTASGTVYRLTTGAKTEELKNAREQLRASAHAASKEFSEVWAVFDDLTKLLRTYIPADEF